MQYTSLSKEALQAEYARVKADYDKLCDLHLSLNLSRGKPETKQVALSNDMLSALPEAAFTIDGTDTRNYGGLEGLPSCRKLFAEILGTKPEEVIIGGNASLQLMYDLIAKAYTNGLRHSEKPWGKLDKVKFLCPYPGYDRHFNLSLSFGMELIPITLNENGPDMDAVEAAVADPLVKGIWCVPKYSNPDGYIYSEETMRRLAALKPASPDFAIMWDNAYCIHSFDGPDEMLPDMLTYCREAGNPDMVYEFASTSKVTFAGAGVSCMAASVDNIQYILKIMGKQTIGYNKVWQLLHVRFLKDRATTLAHMQKHAEIMKPKFVATLEALDKEIAPLGIANWNKPKGGYFVSLNAMPGTASRTLALAKAAGVVMTPAGSTYPGGKEPADSNIRIAPSYPPLSDLEQALTVFCTSLKLAALEKLTNA